MLMSIVKCTMFIFVATKNNTFSAFTNFNEITVEHLLLFIFRETSLHKIFKMFFSDNLDEMAHLVGHVSDQCRDIKHHVLFQADVKFFNI